MEQGGRKKWVAQGLEWAEGLSGKSLDLQIQLFVVWGSRQAYEGHRGIPPLKPTRLGQGQASFPSQRHSCCWPQSPGKSGRRQGLQSCLGTEVTVASMLWPPKSLSTHPAGFGFSPRCCAVTTCQWSAEWPPGGTLWQPWGQRGWRLGWAPFLEWARREERRAEGRSYVW